MRTAEQTERQWHEREDALAARELSDRVRDKTCIPGHPVPAPGAARERMDALEGRGSRIDHDRRALDAQLLEELAPAPDTTRPKEGPHTMSETTAAPPDEAAPDAQPSAPSRLASIRKGRVKAPQRTLIYGMPGVGKSTFGASAPDAVFIPTEDGLDHLDCASFPKANSLDEFEQNLRSLIDDEHDYRTVVVDSLDWLEHLIHAQVCAEYRIESIEQIDYGKGYTFGMTHWRHVLRGLDALRERRRMQVILVAHSAIEKFGDPTTASYDRYVPRLHKHANALVRDWCDNILFATMKITTRTTKGAFGASETKAIDDGQRVLKCTPRPMWVAKNRIEMPDEIPLDYRHFSHYAYGTPLDE